MNLHMVCLKAPHRHINKIKSLIFTTGGLSHHCKHK